MPFSGPPRQHRALLSALTLAACVGLAASACTDIGTGPGSCEEFGASSIAQCPMIIGEQFCSEGGVHVDVGSTIEWMHEPPHSGDHYPVWANSGEHQEVVERGYWVHNLEHGSIVLIHNCPAGCDAELDQLRSVLAARPDHDILLIPDPLLEGSRFAAISWTWVHAFDEPDVDELVCFVDQHYNHSPEIVH